MADHLRTLGGALESGGFVTVSPRLVLLLSFTVFCFLLLCYVFVYVERVFSV